MAMAWLDCVPGIGTPSVVNVHPVPSVASCLVRSAASSVPPVAAIKSCFKNVHASRTPSVLTKALARKSTLRPARTRNALLTPAILEGQLHFPSTSAYWWFLFAVSSSMCFCKVDTNGSTRHCPVALGLLAKFTPRRQNCTLKAPASQSDHPYPPITRH